MSKKVLLLLLLALANLSALAQIGIGNTDPKSQLDISAVNPASPAITDGILIPRVANLSAIPTVAQNGMLVFLTTLYSGNPPGFYYWDQPSTSWKGIAGGSTGWGLTGNSGTTPGTNFVGTTDAADLIFKRNNVQSGRLNPANTSFGVQALNPANSGVYNVAVGAAALANNTNGHSNTATGSYALNVNTSGTRNTAVGTNTMYYNQTGEKNTGVGNNVLNANTIGNNNVAVGSESLSMNMIGNNNTAIGFEAGKAVTGSNNIAIGANTGFMNPAGNNQMNIGQVIYGLDMDMTSFSKIGIAESNPKAKLHIGPAANPWMPTNADGVIISRVNNFCAPANMTADQNGMLVFLTTTVGANQPGFYYWDQPSTSWKPVGGSGSAAADADFYEVGGTTPPDAITDAMFHTGDVAIGKNTAVAKMDIEETNLSRAAAMRLTYNNPTLNAASALRIDMTTSAGTGVLVSQDNRLTVAGGRAINTSNSISGATNNDVIGTDNSFNTTGNGTRNGFSNLFSGSGAFNYGLSNRFLAGNISIGVANTFENTPSGYSTGMRNTMNDSGNGNKTGVHNVIGNSGTGSHYGIRNEMSGTSNVAGYGLYSEFTGSGAGDRYGMRNLMNGNRSGNDYGIYNSISSTGNGAHLGMYNLITGSGTGNQIGINNEIGGNAPGAQDHTGIYNNIYSMGANRNFGMLNVMGGTGNATQYGVFANITNDGTGDKYGLYSNIDFSSAGNHYGVYSIALKSSGYAGYFLGRVALGTAIGNTYILPASRGTANQVMQTDGTGNVSWQTINTTDADFYEVGGTLPPDAITDAMYHTGNVAIGKNTTNYKLDVEETNGANLAVAYFKHANPTSSVVGTDVIRTEITAPAALVNGVVSGTTNVVNVANSVQGYGTTNYINGTNTDIVYGTSNQVTVNGNALKIGTHNLMTTTGTGLTVATRNSSYGTSHTNTIENNFNGTAGNHTGVNNYMGGTSTGSAYGVWNNFIAPSFEKIGYKSVFYEAGVANSTSMGLDNSFGEDNPSTRRGIRNSFANVSSNFTDVGLENQFADKGGSGLRIGVDNSFTTSYFLPYSDNSDFFGMRNAFLTDNTGKKYGLHNTFTSSTGSSAELYGTYTNFVGTANMNGVRYGNYVNDNGLGSGTKYGYYANMAFAGTGAQFGIFSIAERSASFAGYFQGRVHVTNTQLTAADDGQSSLYVDRNRDTRNDGAGYVLSQTNRAIGVRNIWGDSYTFGIAGYCDNDYSRSGGILGGDTTDNYWGSLGYRSSADVTYGVYASAAGYSTPAAGRMAAVETEYTIGGGFYGGMIGSWSKGNLIGNISSGSLFAAYNSGDEYTSGKQIEIVTTGTNKTAAYTVTSTEVVVYKKGKITLANGTARVAFDADYAGLLGDVPVVTTTPMGQCNGIYIESADKTGFTVRELNNGTSNVTVSWIAVGDRIDANTKANGEVLDGNFDKNINDVLFNENNKNENAKAMWSNGQTIEFGKMPQHFLKEIPVSK